MIKQGMSFVNEISGIASGLVTHGLGDGLLERCGDLS